MGRTRRLRDRRGWVRPLAAALVAVGVAASAGPVAGQATDKGADKQPNLFERPLQAQEALTRVGNQLTSLAARNPDIPLERLEHFFEDSTTWVDRSGKVFIVEPAPVQVGEPDPVLSNTVDLASTFELQSKPGSSRTIYLDFTGDTITGTGWNTSYGAIVAEPWSQDATPGAFSNAELTAIHSIWARVAEDFAPFNVNVTTKDLGVPAINRADSSDQVFGTRVLMTTSNNSVKAACGCGGIAYVGVFDTVGSYYQPAFVFNTGTKSAAEAASHEAGHNMGLGHDGTSSVGYYTGHASWAPIMGVGYNRPIVQWSKGEYADANQTQDDYVVMAGNGLVAATDDHGNGGTTATALTDAEFTVDGIIATPTDTDVFTFTSGGGSMTLAANPATVSPNLDLNMELRTSAGALVAASNPASATSSTNSDVATGLGASLSVTIPAGTYTVHLDGVGQGDPLTNGYTGYGSLGRYRLTGTLPAPSQRPVALASASVTTGVAPLTVNFTGSGTDSDGSIATYQWTFSDGGGSALQNPSKTYSNPGSYTATLTVTDNTGQTGSSSVVITVTAPLVPIDVSSVAVTGSTNRQGSAGSATITVKNNASVVVPGAVVSGQWTLTRSSGTTTIGTFSGTTGSAGTVTSTSSRVTASAGDTIKFCVTNLGAPAGTYYSSTLNSAPTCGTWTVTGSSKPGGGRTRSAIRQG